MEKSKFYKAAFAVATAAVSAGKPLNTDTAKQAVDFTLNVYDAMTGRLMDNFKKYNIDMSRFSDFNIQKKLEGGED